MKLEHAFPIEEPRLEIPWGVSEAGFLALLRGAPLMRVTPGHYRLRCRTLGGLEQELQFHFRPDRTSDKTLAEIELHRPLRRHRERQVRDLHARLEQLLGPSHPQDASHLDVTRWMLHAPARWQQGKLTVVHEHYITTGKEFEKVRFMHRGR